MSNAVRDTRAGCRGPSRSGMLTRIGNRPMRPDIVPQVSQNTHNVESTSRELSSDVPPSARANRMKRQAALVLSGGRVLTASTPAQSDKLEDAENAAPFERFLDRLVRHDHRCVG